MKGLNLETVEEIILGMAQIVEENRYLRKENKRMNEENERLRGYLYESNKQTEESCKNVLDVALTGILSDISKMSK